MNEPTDPFTPMTDAELAGLEGGNTVGVLIEIGLALIHSAGALGDFLGGVFDAAGGLERSPPTNSKEN